MPLVPSRTIRSLSLRLALAAVGALGVTAASAQQKIEMKLAYYIGDQHPMSQWLVRWADDLEKKSGGRIVVKRFPGGQMGPVNNHLDFARRGLADVSFFPHGGTPGRFPLTELIQLPYMVGSAEIGTKVLNDPDLRAKYLDGEHKGVRVLMLLTHQPGGVHTAKRPVRSADDFKGMRLRQPSATLREFMTALGAIPLGVPSTEILESMQKGTLDGTMLDYGGAGIAFKLGGIAKFSTDLYVYVSSFGVVMNEEFWAKLPPDLQTLVTTSMSGREKEVGEAWDGIDAIGRKLLADGGGESIAVKPADDARLRKVGADTTETKLKELEGRGLPARAAWELMKELAAKHAKSSRSFWN